MKIDITSRLVLASDSAYYDCQPHYGDLLAEAAKELGALQAKIDDLMLEYCPKDMTPEQIENWKQHQRVVKSTLR